MYKYTMMVAVALTAGMMSVSVSAGEATLKALEKQGVILTESQADDIARIFCESDKSDKSDKSDDGCAALVSKIAELVAANSEDDGAIEKILTAAVEAHPELALSFGDASMTAAPNATATILAVMTDITPTAAGAGSGAPLSFLSIPTPPSGGGGASPN